MFVYSETAKQNICLSCSVMSSNMSGLPFIPSLSFSLLTPSTTRFGPRLGNILLNRNEQSEVQIQTPNFLTSTSRGVIPHLSRDHYGSPGISWINVPFESL